MKKIIILSFILILTAVAAFGQKKGEQVLVGTIEKVEAAEKKVHIKDSKGTISSFQWDTKSVAFGGTEAALWAADAGLIGSNAVVVGVKVGEGSVIRSLHLFGTGSIYVKRGVIRWLEGPPHKLGVKNGDNAEEVFALSDSALLTTSKTSDIAAGVLTKEFDKDRKGTVQIVEKDGVKTMVLIDVN
jgi:hypothetical protein